MKSFRQYAAVELSEKSSYDDFVSFASDYLKLKEKPNIELVKEKNDEMTTASYNPNDKSIKVVSGGRRFFDIARSIAHELVHQSQHERDGVDKLDGTTGSKHEDEANYVAGRIIREYGEKNPKFYTESVEDVSEDLRKWFGTGKKGGAGGGGWDRYNTKGERIGKCAREPGEGKPKCLSKEKAAKMSKKDRASAVRRKRANDSDVDRPGTGNKPINVSNKIGESMKSFREYLNEKNVPTNPSLWSKFKAQAKSKFDVYPSAYANGWASKQYKAAGGKWKTQTESVELDEATKIYQAKSRPEYQKLYGAATQAMYDKMLGKGGMVGDRSKLTVKMKFKDEKSRKKFERTNKSLIGESVEQIDEKATRTAIDKEFNKVTRSGKMDTMAATRHVERKFRVKNVKVQKDKNGKSHVISFTESVEQIDEKYLLASEDLAAVRKQAKQLANKFPKMRFYVIHNKKHVGFGERYEIVTNVNFHMYRNMPIQGQYDGKKYDMNEDTDCDCIHEKSAAWQRKAGKNSEGGLNAAGRASYERENPGSDLKAPVSASQAKKSKGGKAAKRRKSFCARMGGMPGPMKKPNGEPTRKALALRKWDC